jgi:hypothetical protein
MTIKSLKIAASMGLPVLIAAFAIPALAEDVTFTTTGEFSCGSAIGCTVSNVGAGTDNKMVIINNGSTFSVTVAGVDNANVLAGDPNNDDVNVASFNYTANQAGGLVNTAGASFTLGINQVSPVATPGSGSLAGTFSGSINASTSTAEIDFGSSTSLTLGNVLYSLDSETWSFANPGAGVLAVTTDTATVTPEPTFMMLTGLGFAGLALVAYRRRQRV